MAEDCHSAEVPGISLGADSAALTNKFIADISAPVSGTGRRTGSQPDLWLLKN